MTSPDGPHLPPLVVQTGTYNSHNKGDAAMQLAMRDALQNAGVGVVVSTPFPDIDGPLYGEAVIRSRRRNLLIAAVQVGLGWLWRATGRRFDALLLDGEAVVMSRADLVVDLSGDMLTEDAGIHVAVSHYLPLLRAAALGRPYAITAQSIGPFRRTRPLAAWILTRAEFVSARESTTTQYLEEVVPGLEVTTTADMAFLLPVQPPNVELPAGPFVAASVSSLLRGTLQRSSGLDLVDEVAGALDSLAEVAGTSTVLVAHVTGPSEAKDDRILAREVATRMRSQAMVVDQDLDPRAVKGVIGRADLMLGARMHANIAALSQCVPTVALAYSHKTSGIMSDLGLGEAVVDCRNKLEPGAVERAVLDVWARREDLAHTLQEEIPRVRQAARRNARELTDLLLS